jgi:hypothetical protein
MAGIGPVFRFHRSTQPEKKINLANRHFLLRPPSFLHMRMLRTIFCGLPDPCFDAVFPAEKPPIGAFFIKAFDPALTLGNHTRIESFMLRQTVHDQQLKRELVVDYMLLTTFSFHVA